MKIAKTLLMSGSLLLASAAYGSSHREAPAIAHDPSADITDLYVFKSPENENNWVFVMNVAPASLGVAGPNWYRFDDDVLYEMHIDRTGDGVEDITYQFRFTTNDYRSAEGLIISFFPNISYSADDDKYTGALGDNALNQIYEVTKVTGDRRGGDRSSVVSGALVAPPRIGPLTTDGGADNQSDTTAAYQAYATLANNAIKTVGDTKFFAGTRNDPFFVDLGGVFDRVAVRIPKRNGNSS